MEIQIDCLFKDFGIKSGAIVHAGANLCQERDFYRAKGVGPVIWIEGIPSVAKEASEILKSYSNQLILEAALWSHSNVVLSFNITSNKAESSSLLDLKLHKALHPSIEVQNVVEVTTITLDELDQTKGCLPAEIFLLVMDLQGAEFEALKGSLRTLEKTQAVHIEVSTIELYKGQKLFGEIDAFLTARGFTLVTHDLSENDLSGDALYVRNGYVRGQVLKSLPKKNPRLSLTWKGKIKYLAVLFGVPARYFGLPARIFRRRQPNN
jgi:FkbM family methyltransferase